MFFLLCGVVPFGVEFSPVEGWARAFLLFAEGDSRDDIVALFALHII